MKTAISTSSLTAATRRRLWRNYRLEAYLHGIDSTAAAMSGDIAKAEELNAKAYACLKRADEISPSRHISA